MNRCLGGGGGANGGTRTPDRLITNQTHYQLCYVGFVLRVTPPLDETHGTSTPCGSMVKAKSTKPLEGAWTRLMPCNTSPAMAMKKLETT